jgi:hypothetical protein
MTYDRGRVLVFVTTYRVALLCFMSVVSERGKMHEFDSDLSYYPMQRLKSIEFYFHTLYYAFTM